MESKVDSRTIQGMQILTYVFTHPHTNLMEHKKCSRPRFQTLILNYTD
jgi:hypothetical protein